MPSPKKHKQKKKSKKAKKDVKKVILMGTDEDEAVSASEAEDEDESGMYFEKEDIQILYNALRGYTPTEEEELRYELLLEEFEEILVVDYNEPYPDAN
jgi:hypothetical protein